MTFEEETLTASDSSGEWKANFLLWDVLSHQVFLKKNKVSYSGLKEGSCRNWVEGFPGYNKQCVWIIPEPGQRPFNSVSCLIALPKTSIKAVTTCNLFISFCEYLFKVYLPFLDFELYERRGKICNVWWLNEGIIEQYIVRPYFTSSTFSIVSFSKRNVKSKWLSPVVLSLT